jgi:hypothetical protein
MSTLIAIYNSSGCVGRCDANCYNATTPDCDCVCGGANHGRGFAAAHLHTAAAAQQITEAFADAHQDLDVSWYRTDRARHNVRQRLLFPP